MPPRRAGAAPLSQQAAAPARPQPHRQGAAAPLQPPPPQKQVAKPRARVHWTKWNPRIGAWTFVATILALGLAGVAFWPSYTSLVETRKANGYAHWANHFAYYQACVSS